MSFDHAPFFHFSSKDLAKSQLKKELFLFLRGRRRRRSCRLFQTAIESGSSCCRRRRRRNSWIRFASRRWQRCQRSFVSSSALVVVVVVMSIGQLSRLSLTHRVRFVSRFQKAQPESAFRPTVRLSVVMIKVPEHQRMSLRIQIRTHIRRRLNICVMRDAFYALPT